MPNLDHLMYVPRVRMVMTLPYFPTYREWLGHRIDCGPCTAALARDEDIKGLCTQGQELARAVQWDIERQHSIAEQN